MAKTSWIIVRTSTGEPIAEVWTEQTAKSVNPKYFAVYTALEWLNAFNWAVELNGGSHG